MQPASRSFFCLAFVVVGLRINDATPSSWDDRSWAWNPFLRDPENADERPGDAGTDAANVTTAGEGPKAAGVPQTQALGGCRIRNGGCEDICTHTADGVTCSCREGFQLSDDTRTCIDINECDNHPHPCPEGKMCVNGHGSFICLSRIHEPAEVRVVSLTEWLLSCDLIVGMLAWLAVLSVVALMLLCVAWLRTTETYSTQEFRSIYERNLMLGCPGTIRHSGPNSLRYFPQDGAHYPAPSVSSGDILVSPGSDHVVTSPASLGTFASADTQGTGKSLPEKKRKPTSMSTHVSSGGSAKKLTRRPARRARGHVGSQDRIEKL